MSVSDAKWLKRCWHKRIERIYALSGLQEGRRKRKKVPAYDR